LVFHPSTMITEPYKW